MGLLAQLILDKVRRCGIIKRDVVQTYHTFVWLVFFILINVLLQRSYVDMGFFSLMGLVKCLKVDLLQILKRFMKQ